jgi:hypothetical protein
MFLAARLQRGCREIQSAAPGAKAPGEKKRLIGALKRSTTRKLRPATESLRQPRLLPPRTSATRNRSFLQRHARGLRILWMTFSRSFGNVAPASFATSRYNRRGDFQCHPLPIKLAFPAVAVCLR